jgi:CRP-like cAMP-binding protein
VEFEPGEEIIRQGEPGEALYLVLSGEFEVTRSAFGRGSAVAPVHVATLGSGAVVGEMSLVYRRPRNANVVARSRVIAYRLSLAGWIHIQAQYPVFSARIEEIARQRAETLGPTCEASVLVEI